VVISNGVEVDKNGATRIIEVGDKIKDEAIFLEPPVFILSATRALLTQSGKVQEKNNATMFTKRDLDDAFSLTST
jgi:hypothetical protein